MNSVNIAYYDFLLLSACRQSENVTPQRFSEMFFTIVDISKSKLYMPVSW